MGRVAMPLISPLMPVPLFSALILVRNLFRMLLRSWKIGLNQSGCGRWVNEAKWVVVAVVVIVAVKVIVVLVVIIMIAHERLTSLTLNGAR